MTEALERVRKGPRQYVNPETEFINDDMEDYLKFKCKEQIPGERYNCEICKKVFKGEDFVIKHIYNKHKDVVDEAYEKQSTKDWLERNIQHKMKKEMKANYYADENKLFTLPGRRYHSSETSYYTQREDFNGRGGYRGRGGRGGRGRGGYKQYVDLDDPNVNEAKEARGPETRELVDYKDLFG